MKNVKNWLKFNENLVTTAPVGVEIDKVEQSFYEDLAAMVQKNEKTEKLLKYYNKIVKFAKDKKLSRDITLDTLLELSYGRKKSSQHELVIFLEDLFREYLEEYNKESKVSHDEYHDALSSIDKDHKRDDFKQHVNITDKVFMENMLSFDELNKK